MNDDNFFAMDRLVEFGMGVAVAKQMAESMNQTIQNTHIPGSQTPLLVPPSRTYHVVLDGKNAGPFTEIEFSRLITDGRVKKDTHVWRPGMPKWELAENVPEVLRLVALTPPPFTPEGSK